MGPFRLNLLLLKLKTKKWKHYSKIIFTCVNSTVGPFLIFLNAWTVHALFINSVFCLWKVNKCRLKKRGKHWKWKRRCIDVETKRVRYLFQTRDYYFSLMFCVQWIFFLRPFALNVWIVSWNPFLIFLNTWIVHALFINSEFCLWKINKCRLKKKKRKTPKMKTQTHKR